VDKIARMRRISNQLTEELGREPTDEELAEELNMPAAKVAKLRTAAIRPASLDARVGFEEDAGSLGDLISDVNSPDPFKQLESSNLKNEIAELLPLLDERELNILNLRFGLDGKKELTLEEVGEKFKVTRERIRQLQNIALRKLRTALDKKDKIQPAT
jgi:RNA polymerase primary sigma factor